MRHKGLIIVLFAVVTFGFVFGFLKYNTKLEDMLDKEIVQASTRDFFLPPKVDEPEDVGSEEDKVNVPSLMGLTVEEADALLKEQKLIEDPKEEYSDVYEKGIIFWQTPSASVLVPAETKITFSVSLGKSADTPVQVADQIVVPNLIGMSKEAAESELKSLGFNVGYEFNPSEHYDEGFVYSQNYKVSAKVDKGTQVTIRISTGR